MPAPAKSPMDAAEVVRRLGGCAGWRDILAHSTRHSLRRALASGSLKRTSRGTYSLPDASPSLRAAAAMRGLVSHETAAAYWLMESLTPATAVHVTVPKRARPSPRRGVIVHYRNVPPSEDHGGVTSPIRTVLDCAATLPFAGALAIADSALRRDLMTAEQLVLAAQQIKGAGRQRVLKVVGEADGRAANPFESGLRAIARQTGLKGFQPQLHVRVSTLSVWVDLGDPDRCIAVEADSFAYHGSRQALERDCRRYDELVRHGWLVLRFSWEQVMFEPMWVAAVLEDTCALRRGRRHSMRSNLA